MEMRLMYEHLVRRAFKTGRFEDPLKLANASIYDHNIRILGRDLTFGVSEALRLVHLEIDGKSGSRKMSEFRAKLSQIKTPDDLDYVIVEATKLFDELEIHQSN